MEEDLQNFIGGSEFWDGWKPMNKKYHIVPRQIQIGVICVCGCAKIIALPPVSASRLARVRGTAYFVGQEAKQSRR